MSCLNWLVFIIMASALEHSHTPEGVRERLAQGASVSYLRDWIYGAIDGGVTTFAIVAGVVGANLPSSVVLLLGFANLVADGFAMAASKRNGYYADLLEEAAASQQVHHDQKNYRQNNQLPCPLDETLKPHKHLHPQSPSLRR